MPETVLCSDECPLCTPAEAGTRQQRKCQMYFWRVPWLLDGGVCPHTSAIVAAARMWGMVTREEVAAEVDAMAKKHQAANRAAPPGTHTAITEGNAAATCRAIARMIRGGTDA